jgi:hypothetical protein
MAITPTSSAKRRNIADPFPMPPSYGLKPGIFKPRRLVFPSAECALQSWFDAFS